MELRCRVFWIELKEGDGLDRFRISAENKVIVLYHPISENSYMLRRDILRSTKTKTSMMSEGLLDALMTEDMSDLSACWNLLN